MIEQHRRNEDHDQAGEEYGHPEFNFCPPGQQPVLSWGVNVGVDFLEIKLKPRSC